MPSQKLTDEQVIAARRVYLDEDITQKEVAEKFGVSRSYMSKLLRGDRRSDLWTPDVGVEYNRQEDHPGSKLTESKVVAIRKAYWLDEISQRTIAEEYDVSRDAIQAVISAKSWPDCWMPSNEQRKKRSDKDYSPKLTAEIAYKCRVLYDTGDYTYDDLIAYFDLDVSRQSIANAVKGNTWKNVRITNQPPDIPMTTRPDYEGRNRKIEIYISEEEHETIKEASHEARTSMSAYIRELVLPDARERTGRAEPEAG